MNGHLVMTRIADRMQLQLPNRLVTRNALDFAQRQAEEMERGVITLVALAVEDLDTQRDLADTAGKLRILLMGEFKLAESAQGEDVERAEWELWQEVYAFLLCPGLGLCPLAPKRLQLSGQEQAPYGWIAVDLEYSELD